MVDVRLIAHHGIYHKNCLAMYYQACVHRSQICGQYFADSSTV